MICASLQSDDLSWLTEGSKLILYYWYVVLIQCVVWFREWKLQYLTKARLFVCNLLFANIILYKTNHSLEKKKIER